MGQQLPSLPPQWASSRYGNGAWTRTMLSGIRTTTEVLMPAEDLRQWLDKVDKIGELRTIDNASWKLEIGAITTVN